jgi:hypothetical protein
MASFVPDDGGAGDGTSLSCMFPRQCGFLESNTKIVVGTHSGEVHVYDRAGGYPKYLLGHSPGYPARTVSVGANHCLFVQTLMVKQTWESASKCMVLTASSTNTPDMTAALWVRDFRGSQMQPRGQPSVRARQQEAYVHTNKVQSATVWGAIKRLADGIITWTIRLGIVALLWIMLVRLHDHALIADTHIAHRPIGTRSLQAFGHL